MEILIDDTTIPPPPQEPWYHGTAHLQNYSEHVQIDQTQSEKRPSQDVHAETPELTNA
jgi:hypothetical protein